VVATIYLATSRTGCLKELERLLIGQARGVVSFPRALHEIDVVDLTVVDLSTDAALDTVGLTVADLADDDRTACQAVGNAVQYLGIPALVARSATGDGNILAVYEPHLRPGQLTVRTSTSIER
jgi:hypothetical protein